MMLKGISRNSNVGSIPLYTVGVQATIADGAAVHVSAVEDIVSVRYPIYRLILKHLTGSTGTTPTSRTVRKLPDVRIEGVTDYLNRRSPGKCESASAIIRERAG